MWSAWRVQVPNTRAATPRRDARRSIRTSGVAKTRHLLQVAEDDLEDNVVEQREFGHGYGSSLECSTDRVQGPLVHMRPTSSSKTLNRRSSFDAPKGTPCPERHSTRHCRECGPVDELKCSIGALSLPSSVLQPGQLTKVGTSGSTSTGTPHREHSCRVIRILRLRPKSRAHRTSPASSGSTRIGGS